MPRSAAGGSEVIATSRPPSLTAVIASAAPAGAARFDQHFVGLQVTGIWQVKGLDLSGVLAYPRCSHAVSLMVAMTRPPNPLPTAAPARGSARQRATAM